MRRLLMIVLSFHALKVYGLDISQWSARERQMAECLSARGWRHEDILSYHRRVLDTRRGDGVVSRADQDLVAGCVSTADFLSYGLTPENPPTVPASLPVYDRRVLERQVMSCLRNRGLGQGVIRSWYNRVLNPNSRAGAMSIRDKDLAHSCLTQKQYTRMRHPREIRRRGTRIGTTRH